MVLFMIVPFRILVSFMSSPWLMRLWRLPRARHRRLVGLRGHGRLHHSPHVGLVDRVDAFCFKDRVGLVDGNARQARRRRSRADSRVHDIGIPHERRERKSKYSNSAIFLPPTAWQMSEELRGNYHWINEIGRNAVCSQRLTPR